jgi:hypothetical protein
MKRKHPRKGERKETRDKDSPKEAGHKEESEPLKTQLSTSHMKHIN